MLDYKGLGQNVIVRTIAAKHKLTGEQANALFKLISEEYQEEQLKLDGLKLGFQIKKIGIGGYRTKAPPISAVSFGR